jgi:hypothetical protein
MWLSEHRRIRGIGGCQLAIYRFVWDADLPAATLLSARACRLHLHFRPSHRSMAACFDLAGFACPCFLIHFGFGIYFAGVTYAWLSYPGSLYSHLYHVCHCVCVVCFLLTVCTFNIVCFGARCVAGAQLSLDCWCMRQRFLRSSAFCAAWVGTGISEVLWNGLWHLCMHCFVRAWCVSTVEATPFLFPCTHRSTLPPCSVQALHV